MSTTAWFRRVIIERNDLMEKINLAEAYISSDAFKKLKREYQTLLKNQVVAMKAYCAALNERIDYGTDTKV